MLDKSISLDRCFFVRHDVPIEGLPSDAVICVCGWFCEISLSRRGLEFNDLGLMPAEALRGKFWWTRGSLKRIYPDISSGSYDDALSTEDIFASIGQGCWGEAKEGPFDSREDAQYALDRAWESPE